jgi:hypothetical protein
VRWTKGSTKTPSSSTKNPRCPLWGMVVGILARRSITYRHGPDKVVNFKLHVCSNCKYEVVVGTIDLSVPPDSRIAYPKRIFERFRTAPSSPCGDAVGDFATRLCPPIRCMLSTQSRCCDETHWNGIRNAFVLQFSGSKRYFWS